MVIAVGFIIQMTFLNASDSFKRFSESLKYRNPRGIGPLKYSTIFPRSEVFNFISILKLRLIRLMANRLGSKKHGSEKLNIRFLKI